MNAAKKSLIVLIVLLSGTYHGYSQSTLNYDYKHMYAGLGLGLDYGGVGLKVEYLPIKYFSAFGAIGYNLQGPGINFGVSYKILPNRKFTPLVQAMFGYNSAIVVDGLATYNQTYYGLSAGIGADLRLGRKGNKLYFGLFYPFRPSEFYDDMDKVKADPRISSIQDALPITFSIGFNWALF